MKYIKGRFFKELLSFIFCVSSVYYLLHMRGGPDGAFVVVLYRILLGLSPIVFFFFILKVFFKNRFVIPFILSIVYFLIFINAKKEAATKSVLSWGDLTSFENYRIAIRFAGSISILFACLGFVLLSVLAVFSLRKNTKFLNACYLLLSIFVSFFAFPNYWSGPFSGLSDKVIASYGKNLNVYYIVWDWSENVKRNGIITHLVQTSFRNIPVSASKTEEALFNKNTAWDKVKSTDSRQKHIIYILCEACWHDDVYFKDAFLPMDKAGFVSLRTISPAYGGGTSNAEFEMYTGLSSRTVLDGIVFQEYNSKISSKSTKTIISSLRDKGYFTYGMHNFYKHFWLRDEVFPKLGFSHFFGIEDLKTGGYEQSPYPHDDMLFDNAKATIKENLAKPFFLSLITVSTHSPYSDNQNDMGSKDYYTRLKLAISQIASFTQDIKNIDPNVLIVVYGDHKPGLGDFFRKNKILQDGEKRMEVVGDVPVYIYSGNNDMDDKFYSQVNGMPMFCLTSALDYKIIKSGNPSSKFMHENICSKYKSYGYDRTLNNIPSWLYYMSLFKV